MLAFYGDKISNNMAETPEGYLACLNVPIGRIGWMDYYGQELPANFNEEAGALCKVYRSPKELFSAATLASFNCKSVTNTHPASNLSLQTVEQSERGQATNIRRDGDFLLADLIIKDGLLISEIRQGTKREVSCGYDCMWLPLGKGKYEQKEIIGNHIAIVVAGRAGPRVAIQDRKPPGGLTMAKKVYWTALGFKQWAMDASPSDIAEAMDALGEEEKEEVTDCMEEEKKDKKEPAQDAMTKLNQTMDAICARLDKLEGGSKEKPAEDAKTVMDALEEELKDDPKEKEAKDEDPEEEEKEDPEEEEEEEEAKDEEPEEEEEKEEKKSAADAKFRKFVKDMKPVIMALPNEKDRVNMAKKLRNAVQDARGVSRNSYGEIAAKLSSNRTTAMDSNKIETSYVNRSINACNALAAAGEKLKGGK